MAEAKRFRVYIETRVSTVVELDAEDLVAALEAAPGHGPFVSSNDNAWEQSGDWEALTAYDAITDKRLFPLQDATQQPCWADAEISAYRSDGDNAFVVQIDTADDLGQLRVFVNDNAVYDADPDTGESQLNVDTRQQAHR